MARGDISVGIDYEGTEEGAQQLDGLLTRLTATEEAQNGAARSAKAFEDKLKATARAADKAKQQQDRLRAALASQISGWGALGGAIENDPKARHVAAAASKACAQVIVTQNLRDEELRAGHIRHTWRIGFLA